MLRKERKKRPEKRRKTQWKLPKQRNITTKYKEL